MKLEPGERSILATFHSREDGERALNALKQAGYADAALDRIGSRGSDPEIDEIRPVISGKETSMVRAILNPAQMDDDSAILMGASIEASGLSGEMQLDGTPYLLTVVTNEQRLQEAVDLLEEYGGKV